MVYFINKVTGYKFAGYKSLRDGDELSFWNAEDRRIDYLDVDADDYLFPIVRRILSSNKTNKELCSTEIQNQVMSECGYHVRKMSSPEPVNMDMGEEIGEMEVREPRYMGEVMFGMEEQIQREVDRDIVNQLREVAREHYPEDSISETMPMRA